MAKSHFTIGSGIKSSVGVAYLAKSASPERRIRSEASELPISQRLRLSLRASFMRASGSTVSGVFGLDGDSVIPALAT